MELVVSVTGAVAVTGVSVVVVVLNHSLTNAVPGSTRPDILCRVFPDPSISIVPKKDGLKAASDKNGRVSLYCPVPKPVTLLHTTMIENSTEFPLRI
jgi:hypothetical protein